MSPINTNDSQNDQNLGGDPDLRTPPELLDSYAPFEVQLIVPTFSLEGPRTGFIGAIQNLLYNLNGADIGSHNVLVGLTMESAGEGAWTASVQLYDPQRAITTALEVIPADRRRIKFRFNWQKKGLNLSDLAFLEGRIMKIEPEYRAEGTILKLDLIDVQADGIAPAQQDGSGESEVTQTSGLGQLTSRQLGYRRFAFDPEATGSGDDEEEPTGGAADADLENGRQRVTFNANPEPAQQRVLFPASSWSPSHIVAAIATALGWRYVIEESRLFDPTETNGLEMAADQTAFQFIRDNIKPVARNAENEHFLFFTRTDPFTGESTVHFHSPSFLSTIIRREYTYVRDKAGDVISFDPQDEAYYVALLGGADSTFIYNNAESGLPGELAARTEAGVQTVTATAAGGADDIRRNVPHVHVDADNADNTRAPLTQSGGPEDQNVTLLPDRGERGADSRARSHYARIRHLSYSANLTVMGNHDVRILDFVRINYYDAVTSAPSHLSGVYRVMKLTHEIGSGGWTTAYELLRGNRQVGGAGTSQEGGGTIALTDSGSGNE